MKKILIFIAISLFSLNGFAQNTLGNMTEVTSSSGSDLFYTVTSGNSRSITYTNLFSGLLPTTNNTYYGLNTGLLGTYNSGFGNEALNAITSGGNYNFAGGYQSLLLNQTGDRNVALGAGALGAITSNSHSYNTAIGNQAGLLFLGDRCIMIGNQAGRGYAGERSVLIGDFAGSIATGDSIICIGNKAGQTASQSQTLWIGEGTAPTIWGDLKNDTIRINGYLDVTGGSSISGGGSTEWTLSGSDLYPNLTATNILAGTTTNSGSYKFEVLGNSYMTGTLETTGNLTVGGTLGLPSGTTVNNILTTVSGTSDNALVTEGGLVTYSNTKWTKSGNYVYNSNDSIKINGNTPTADLDVTGKVYVDGWLQAKDSIKVGTSSTLITANGISLDTLFIGTDTIAQTISGDALSSLTMDSCIVNDSLKLNGTWYSSISGSDGVFDKIEFDTIVAKTIIVDGGGLKFDAASGWFWGKGTSAWLEATTGRVTLDAATDIIGTAVESVQIESGTFLGLTAGDSLYFDSDSSIFTGYIKADSAVFINNNYSDIAFEDDFELMTFDEQMQYAYDNGHLPSMPKRTGRVNPISYINKLELELEKAYLYIEEMNTRIEAIESKIKNN